MAYQANLGTLLLTCDAVGACLAVPGTPHYQQALARGDTLPRRSCIHWISTSKDWWLSEERQRGTRIVAVELAEDGSASLNVAVAGSLVLYRLAGLC